MWWSFGSDLHFSGSPAPYFPSFASLWCSMTINIPTLSWGLLKAEGLIQGSSKTCKLSIFYCNSSPPPPFTPFILAPPYIPPECPNSFSILLWPSNSQRGTTRSFVFFFHICLLFSDPRCIQISNCPFQSSLLPSCLINPFFQVTKPFIFFSP